LPEGYFADYGGQFENQQRAMGRLMLVVPLSIGLIFLMLFMAFQSIRNALLVLSNLPFAFVGGILLILILGINLSVSASVGFIALFGVAVQNGVLLVTFFTQLRTQGLSPRDAIIRGCELRLRPLLMTSMAAFLGLWPMLYATGSGAEIQRPIAAVVMGGLVTALLLTLIVLPALYYLLETRKDRMMNLNEAEEIKS
jgi:cobalt-zinc-cadmium resistance protein CzcA